MLKARLSIPELKAQAVAIGEMALDALATLQTPLGNLRVGFEEWMNDVMRAELALHLGREPYERKGAAGNHRNGYRSRKITVKSLGTLELRIPRDRKGSFKTGVVPRRIQYDPRIDQDLQMLFLGSASTRTVELLSERLFGRKLSSSEVSQANNVISHDHEATLRALFSRPWCQQITVFSRP